MIDTDRESWNLSFPQTSSHGLKEHSKKLSTTTINQNRANNRIQVLPSVQRNGTQRVAATRRWLERTRESQCAEGRAPRATQWARSAACSRPLGARFFDRTNDLFSRFSILPSSRLFQLNLVEKNLRKLLNKLFHNNHKLEQIEQKNFMKIDVLISRSIILFPDFSQLFLSSLKTIRTKPIWSTPTEKVEIYLFPKLPVMDWKNTVRNFPQQQ